MSYPKVLYQYPQRAGELFRPSNGTEGMVWMAEFCDECFFSPECDLIMRSMAYGVEDDEYPGEWVYSSDGWPICEKFTRRGDGGVPVEVLPEDPDQLCINFYLPEVLSDLEQV